jgi:hypothetical protein
MKPEHKPEGDAQPALASTRKAYQKPELQVYGDLAEITRNVNMTKTPDGTGHPNKHFTS